MKTWIWTGGAGLSMADAPQQSLGHGQIRVRLRAASLNFRDLLVKAAVTGTAGRSLIPLSDGAGQVVELGSGVSNFVVGDKVMGNFFQAWSRGMLTPKAWGSALGGDLPGVLAEEAIFNADCAVHIPAHLSYEEAATLPCAGVTAWHALMERGALRPGETVLTQGSGGVSVFALQMAKMAGARVIATTSSANKAARLKALGADEVINYKDEPDWHSAVLKLTNGRGADLAIEVGGADTLEKSILATRMCGRIAMIGALTGRGSAPVSGIFARSLTVHGIYVGSTEMFERMNQALGVHQLRPVIDNVFDFAQAPQAFAHFEGRGHFGKVVIRI